MPTCLMPEIKEKRISCWSIVVIPCLFDIWSKLRGQEGAIINRGCYYGTGGSFYQPLGNEGVILFHVMYSCPLPFYFIYGCLLFVWLCCVNNKDELSTFWYLLSFTELMRLECLLFSYFL